MRYGLSAGAIVVRDDRVLLVHHQTEQHDFWIPPGGRLEDAESILDCAQREAFEETGLRVAPQRIVYIQEIVEPGYHFAKFWVLCSLLGGMVSVANRDPDEGFLVEALFASRGELEALCVYPEMLRDTFWDDLADGFAEMRYLGPQQVAG